MSTLVGLSIDGKQTQVVHCRPSKCSINSKRTAQLEHSPNIFHMFKDFSCHFTPPIQPSVFHDQFSVCALHTGTQGKNYEVYLSIDIYN